MKNYKPLYDKAKELIELLDDCNFSTMVDKEQWMKRKDLYNELHQLEAEIEKEEQPQPEKTADLREELIKFSDYASHYLAGCDNTEEEIDEYLKQK